MNSPALFRTVPSPTPYGLLFSKIRGFATPPKTLVAIISGTGKATDFKFGRYIHTSQGPSEQKPIKNFRENGAWAYPGTAQSFKYPLLSQKRVQLQTSNLAGIHSHGPSEQKPVKNFGEKGA